jgi:hypothetical protein
LFLTTLRYIAQKRFGSAYVLGKHVSRPKKGWHQIRPRARKIVE